MPPPADAVLIYRQQHKGSHRRQAGRQHHFVDVAVFSSGVRLSIARLKLGRIKKSGYHHRVPFSDDEVVKLIASRCTGTGKRWPYDRCGFDQYRAAENQRGVLIRMMEGKPIEHVCEGHGSGFWLFISMNQSVWRVRDGSN